jgi:hypothetical protein
LFDRMRDVFAPLRLRMIFAGVGENAQLPVGSRRKSETDRISDFGFRISKGCVFVEKW